MSSDYQIRKGMVGGYKISYDCPHCSTALTSALDEAGKTESCPDCGRPFVVPGSGDRERIRQTDTLAAESKRKEREAKKQEKKQLREARRKEAIIQSQLARIASAPSNEPSNSPTNEIQCPFCGEKILAVAKKCKHCGEFLTDTPQHVAKAVASAQMGKSVPVAGCGCLAFLGLFAVLLAIGSATNNDDSGRGSSSGGSHDKVMAWVMAQQFVRDQLKSPSTASFGGMFSDSQSTDKVVTDLGSGKYRVNAWVDAQNSFGATLRQNFICELEHTGGDNWRCTKVLLLPR